MTKKQAKAEAIILAEWVLRTYAEADKASDFYDGEPDVDTKAINEELLKLAASFAKRIKAN